MDSRQQGNRGFRYQHNQNLHGRNNNFSNPPNQPNRQQQQQQWGNNQLPNQPNQQRNFGGVHQVRNNMISHQQNQRGRNLPNQQLRGRNGGNFNNSNNMRSSRPPQSRQIPPQNHNFLNYFGSQSSTPYGMQPLKLSVFMGNNTNDVLQGNVDFGRPTTHNNNNRNMEISRHQNTNHNYDNTNPGDALLSRINNGPQRLDFPSAEPMRDDINSINDEDEVRIEPVKDPMSIIHALNKNYGSVRGGEKVEVYFSLSENDYFKSLQSTKKEWIKEENFQKNSCVYFGNVPVMNCHYEVIETKKYFMMETYSKTLPHELFDMMRRSQFVLQVASPKAENQKQSEEVIVSLDLRGFKLMREGNNTYLYLCDDDILKRKKKELEDEEQNYRDRKRREDNNNNSNSNNNNQGEKMDYPPQQHGGGGGFLFNNYHYGRNQESNNSLGTTTTTTKITRGLQDWFHANILFYAVSQNDMNLVKTLIEDRKMDVLKRDTLGYSIFDICRYFKYEKMLEYLTQFLWDPLGVPTCIKVVCPSCNGTSSVSSSSSTCTDANPNPNNKTKKKDCAVLINPVNPETGRREGGISHACKGLSKKYGRFPPESDFKLKDVRFGGRIQSRKSGRKGEDSIPKNEEDEDEDEDDNGGKKTKKKGKMKPEEVEEKIVLETDWTTLYTGLGSIVTKQKDSHGKLVIKKKTVKVRSTARLSTRGINFFVFN